MNKEIKEYREKHKKCKWCKFFKARDINFVELKQCELKDKIIYNESMPRLCKYYKIREEQ